MLNANTFRHLSARMRPQHFADIMNFWLPYRAAGIHIDYIRRDYRQVHVSMDLHWYNSNYVGTHFGGSLFAMVDPFYMIMYMQNLGKDYIVWDKAASIRFLRPGQGKVSALFTLTEADLQAVHGVFAQDPLARLDVTRTVVIKNSNLQTVAEVDKIIYIRRKPRSV